MRYAWHMKESYFEKKGLKAWLLNRLLDRLRAWDRATARGVSHFVAISETVRRRIRDCYGRDSVVIYPPVDTNFYHPARVAREDYYLLFSAFAPYKRLDVAIEACNRLKRKLIVIGTGQEERKLRGLAGPTISFLGWQPDRVVRDHLWRCRALLFPGEEDFGIVPVEAMACGTPVIAYARGGATETVTPLGASAAPTGLWFAEQTPECLAEALEQMDSVRDVFDAAALRKHALAFSYRRFEDEIFDYVRDVLGTRSSYRRVA
jgi:glycosyltransferase involved in cell wall biosynthesis